jgi:acetyl esterase/lipase
MNAVTQQEIAPTPMSFGGKTSVFLWRNILMPFIELIGGKKFPPGRVITHRYGTLKDAQLDWIKPASSATARTAIVHIHGGGWIAGSKGKFYSKPLLKFSDAGYPVFSLNYPLAPEHPHPTALRSLLQALAWIKKEHPAYSNIHLIGDSAGGNLAMMLGIMISNPALLRLVDPIDVKALPTIKSIVPLYGVHDRITFLEDKFPSGATFLKSYAGADAHNKNFASAIPVTPMDLPTFTNLSPTFIVAASKDKLLRSSQIFAAHLAKSFDHVTYKVYEGADHGFFSFGKQCDALSDDLLAYFEQLETRNM